MSDYTEDKQARFPELLKIREALSEQYFCTGATLIEENNDTDNRPFKMEVNLKGYQRLTYLLYQFDDEKYPYALLPFFSDEKGTGLHRMCDYISFVETDDSMYVILFELKKGVMCIFEAP